MLTYFWIMFGGALGSGARFWASGLVANRFGAVFPLGTLFVNVSGSFAIGFFAAFTAPGGPFLVSPRVREFILIGVCGGYTTFSTFSMDTFYLMERGEAMAASAYLLGSVILSVGALVTAIHVVRALP